MPDILLFFIVVIAWVAAWATWDTAKQKHEPVHPIVFLFVFIGLYGGVWFISYLSKPLTYSHEIYTVHIVKDIPFIIVHGEAVSVGKRVQANLNDGDKVVRRVYDRKYNGVWCAPKDPYYYKVDDDNET